MRTFITELDHIDPVWKEGRDYQLVCGREEPCNKVERDARFNTAKSNRFLPWRVAAAEIGTVPVNQGDLCLFLVGADIEQDIPGEWVLMEYLSEEWFAASKHTCGSYQDHFKEDSKIKKWRQENQEYVQKQFQSFQEAHAKWRENNPERFVEIQIQSQEAAQVWNKENPEKVQERLDKMWSQADKWRSENRESMLKQLAEARIKSQMWRENNPDLHKEQIAKLVENHKKWQKENHDQVANQLRELSKIKYQCTITGKISTAGPLSIYQRKRGIDTSNRIRL